MGRSTPKTNESVQVPKDGPILWHLNSPERANDASRAAIGITESLELLSLTKHGSEHSEVLEVSYSQELWRILTNSDQIRQQLQALQAYRSRLLHLKEIDKVDEVHELTGTYRLLLEWYLTQGIPSSLKRAILSNLETLSSIIEQDAYRIREQVILSLQNNEQQCWSINPLRTLFEILNYETMKSIIVHDCGHCAETLDLLVREADALRATGILEEQSFYDHSESPQAATSRSAVAVMEKAALIAQIIKLFVPSLLLTMHEATANLVLPMETLQVFLWSSLSCRGMPADELNVVGVAYAQTILYHWKYESKDDSTSSTVANKALIKVKTVTMDTALPHQNKLAVVQGIAATLPEEVLMSLSPPIFFEPLETYLFEQCRTASGAAIRLSALRALHTLVSRLIAIASTPILEECHLLYINRFCDSTLEVVLQAWESPPAKQVTVAVPGLFRSLIVLLRKSNSSNDLDVLRLSALVRRIIDLPDNRKGKYVALETLLPEIGGKFLIEAAGQELISSLIKRISEGGDNIVAMSDLLGELLSRLRVEMNEEAGLVVNDVRLNQKERRRREKKIVRGEIHVESVKKELPFLEDWVALWAPQLARAFVFGSMSERKHVSAHCIPLLIRIVGGTTRRDDAPIVFSFLLEEIRSQRDRACSTGEHVDLHADYTETMSDRILWATLEIAKQALLLKLLKPSNSSFHLSARIATSIPDYVLQLSLTHHSQSIQLAAFASIEAVVRAHFPVDTSPVALLEKEITHWRNALPYICKGGSKEFHKELFLILSSLLYRLTDGKCINFPNKCDDDTATTVLQGLPILTSFVCDFLITDLLVRLAAYPGTVSVKEEFALGLLQCILSFVSQDESEKPKARRRRELRAIETAAMQNILTFLLEDEPMSAFFSLFHSMWDNTRTTAFACMCRLVEHAHARGLVMSKRFSSPESIRYIQARAIYLASSPRQREADTGSKILAFVAATHKTEEARREHVAVILTLLSERLDIMSRVLGGVMVNSSRIDEMEEGRDNLVVEGTKMPMAHGLMMALRLTVDNHCVGKNNAAFYTSFASICCRALQLALSIVADLKEATTIDEEGWSDEYESSRTVSQGHSSSVPLNINTGTISANAGFSSSIQGKGEDDAISRSALQRIIMASWLMTKEACASLASLVTCPYFDPPLLLVEKVGGLLISTLTALKHQGAAFAAHRSLQDIVQFCFATSLDESFEKLPYVWAKRLMRGITGADNVRDSTLRRSTGYSLAFLSIMRSEPPSCITPRTLCPDILSTLIRLSFSTVEDLEKYMKQIGWNLDLSESFRSGSTAVTFEFGTAQNDSGCDQWRTRVHALNILRLAILDAPLASDTKPFIGDAIVSSMIGYEDAKWAVRNSATMVFAAAMLRVVDANKNASSSGGNAITVTELFRTYPVLPEFLLLAMKKGARDMRFDNMGNTEISSSQYPSLYPILLLLSRVQPVAVSGEAAAAAIEKFVPLVLECLKHRHHKVRLVASRALANISSEECGRQSFYKTLLEKCEGILSSNEHTDWNEVHGALLGIQTLLSCTSNSAVIMSQYVGLRAKIWHLVEADNWLYFPSPCVSIVLEILVEVALSTNEGSLTVEMAQTCLTIVSGLDKQNSAGIAQLGAVAAQGFCKCCLSRIWDPTLDSMTRARLLNRLSVLLEDSMFDVRLEAIKAFKKTICPGIDRLLAQNNATRYEQRVSVLQVARTVQKALVVELNRTESYLFNIGMHPPTVRRLSRCLLECCHALRRLETDVEVVDELPAATLWKIATKILELDDDPDLGISLLITDRRLNGNAIELMAFALQRWSSEGQLFINAELRLFVKLAARLNDAHASWRLRYSVAIAIATSEILLLTKTDEVTKDVQMDIINELLSLLQDSDPDVRYIAGEAILQLDPSKQYTSLSSQLLLERGYILVSERFSEGEMNGRLLDRLAASCQGALRSIDFVESEMVQSQTGESHRLMNLGTGRKIFEDEVANEFEEVVLSNQLRVAAVVKAWAPLHNKSDRHQELLELCSNLLVRLIDHEVAKEKTNRFLEVAHEVTLSKSTFPFIHSVLIGCVAAVYLGANDSKDVRGQAQRLVSLLRKKRESTIHPCVRQPLEVLASARKNDSKTKIALLQCCFLLPANSDILLNT